MASAPYKIQYSEEAENDLQSARSFDQKKILEGIETHLRFEPAKESRSRIKKMNQPFWSQYRLRVEDFRVYYDLDEEKGIIGIIRILKKGQRETTKEPTHETN
jgi:mRNA interferase RelE/StbE